MKNYTLSVLLAFVLMSCSQKQETKETATKGFELSQTMLKSIKTAKAENQYVENTYSFYGKISADKNSYIDVYPLVGGNVMSVNVELGDYVKKGQVMATIRSTELAEVQKEVSDARTDLVIAQNNLRVANEMYEGKLNTEKDVREARSQLQKAMDQMQRSKAVSTVYNVKKGNIYQVLAPISGYIVQKNINKDMQLRSDRSDNIFDVANTSKVWSIVNINESDISKVSLGMRAQVSTLIDPEKVYYGKIDKIFKIIDPETNSMQARVVLDNTNGELIPESKATIKVSSTENTVAVTIPKNALIFDDNKYFVVLLKPHNQAKIQEVKILKQSGEKAFISEGLSENDVVITENQLLIYRSLNE